MRRKIVAGNWKMNKTVPEAVELARSFRELFESDHLDLDVVLCPPFVDLVPVGQVIAGSRIALGAQNLHWEEKGAFTGEVSAEMLLSAGCKFVIIGHSERRQYFGETDQTVNRRVRRALASGLTPIVCVGETLEERRAGRTHEVVERQVRGAFEALSPSEIDRTVIAYEPVWAIGTGVNATPEQAQEVHQFIRSLIEELAGKEVASRLRIQYGGSVTPSNAADLMRQADVDGALVGGASLKADSFYQIVKAAAAA
ncbi:MAG: triose-phosphate isomerase [candidate division KSB1 bacterium]|nr:triose-phosphate isomerase [candidate division KSB1 bacterium]